jgi:hypothetical protein
MYATRAAFTMLAYLAKTGGVMAKYGEKASKNTG